MDHRTGLADVTCPVLVLSGAHDPVCGPASTEELVAALPNGTTTWVRFERSSDAIAADEPDGFLEAVRAFIAA
ncbi:MAG: alpha/beta hydrolase [Actinomycetota bacterium]|nr:alpha/beta hydrolase [Actinomycetota bacterium]